MHRGAALRQLDVELDGRDERLPDCARLFGFGGGSGGSAGDELVSAEGTGGAAAVGREPGGDAVEAKLVAARETDGVLGCISLVTDGATVTVGQISFRDNGELGYDVLCHCSDFFKACW